MKKILLLVILTVGCSAKGIEDHFHERPRFLRGTESVETRQGLIAYRDPTQTIALLANIELADLALVAATKEGKAHRLDLLEPKTNSPLFIVYEIPKNLTAINYRSRTYYQAQPGQVVTLPGLSFGLTVRQLFSLLVGRLPDNFIDAAKLYRSGEKTIATHHRLGTAVFKENQLEALEIPNTALIEYQEYDIDLVPREIIIHDYKQDLSIVIYVEGVSTEPLNLSRFIVQHPQNFTRVSTLSLE